MVSALRVAISLLVVYVLGVAFAAARDFPAKPITMVCTNSAGTTPDTVARIIAAGMSKELEQQIVVENKTGANSTIGYGYVAKQAPADGYTIALVGVSELVTLPSVVKDLRFDPLKDLPPLLGLVEGKLLFSSSSQFPWKTFQELVAHARANPGKLNFGAATSQVRFPMEVLLQGLGIKVAFIPYSGGGPYVMATSTGEIHMALLGEAAAISLGTRIRVLAVTGKKRSTNYPEAPTFLELGHPKIQGVAFSLNVPVGVPRPVFEKLNTAASLALQRPEVKTRFANVGLDIVEEAPDVAAKRLADGARVSAEVAKSAGIRPE